MRVASKLSSDCHCFRVLSRRRSKIAIIVHVPKRPQQRPSEEQCGICKSHFTIGVQDAAHDVRNTISPSVPDVRQSRGFYCRSRELGHIERAPCLFGIHVLKKLAAILARSPMLRGFKFAFSFMRPAKKLRSTRCKFNPARSL